MIICFLGGIGSGKTLSVVKEIINKNQFVFTNFELKNLKNYRRIMYKDIFEEKEKGKFDVNWKFWNDFSESHKEGYSIVLDEVHNLIHSRRSMTGTNILMSKWVSQIRKILSDSEHNHLYLISQTLRKIDVDFRDLIHIFIVCKSVNIKGKVWIKQTWYDGLENFLNAKSKIKTVFLGNPYFKYYDTKKIVFEEERTFI